MLPLIKSREGFSDVDVDSAADRLPGRCGVKYGRAAKRANRTDSGRGMKARWSG